MVRNVVLSTATINARVNAAAVRRGATESANQLRRVQRSSRALARQQRLTNAAIRNFGRNVLSARRAIGLLVGGGALGALITRATDAGASLSELSTRTGIAVEELQILQRQFEGDGLEAAQFEKVINNLSRRVGEAHDGVETYASLFRELGVAVTDTNGEQRQTVDVIRDLTSAFPRMTNESRRLAIASELLGQRGIAALTTFLRGPEAFAASAEAMRELGVVSQEQADDLKELQQEFTNTRNVISTAFFIAVANSSQEIQRLNLSLREIITNAIPPFLRAVRFVIDNLGTIRNIIIGLIALKFVIAITAWASAIAALSVSVGVVVAVGAPLVVLAGIIAALVIAFADTATVNRFGNALSGIGVGAERAADGFERLYNFLNRRGGSTRGLSTDEVLRRAQDFFGDEIEGLSREELFRRALQFYGGDENGGPIPVTITGGRFTDYRELTEQETKALRNQEVVQRLLVQREEERLAVARQYSETVTDGFLAVVEGASSAKEAFRDLATTILRDLLRIRIAESLTNIFSGFGRGPQRGVGGTRLTPFNQGFGNQAGGYIGSPRITRVGEAGPELVALPGGSRVYPTGTGPGGGASYVFNINSTDGPGVRQAIETAIPVITNITLGRVAEEISQPGPMREAIRQV